MLLESYISSLASSPSLSLENDYNEIISVVWCLDRSCCGQIFKVLIIRPDLANKERIISQLLAVDHQFQTITKTECEMMYTAAWAGQSDQ